MKPVEVRWWSVLNNIGRIWRLRESLALYAANDGAAPIPSPEEMQELANLIDAMGPIAMVSTMLESSTIPTSASCLKLLVRVSTTYLDNLFTESLKYSGRKLRDDHNFGSAKLFIDGFRDYICLVPQAWINQL